MKIAVLGGLVSGILLCLAFPNFSWFPVAWCALVPYLFVCLGRSGGWKGVLAAHLAFCGAFFGGLLYWIPGVLVNYGSLPPSLGWLALFLVVLLLAAIAGVFPLLVSWTARRSVEAAALAAPGFWILAELLRNKLPFNGFPWGSVGSSQLPYSWVIQTADLGSVYLVSGLVVMVNAGVLMALRYRRYRLIILAAAAFGLSNLYGFYRIHVWTPSSAGDITVGICQGDIGLKSDLEHYAGKYFKTLAGLFEEAAGRGARWIIFPEAQNPYRYDRDFYFREFWSAKARAFHAYLLFNSTTSDELGYYNSALLLNPNGEMVYRYQKSHLVPFGEYLPLSSLLGNLPALVAEVSSFRAGPAGEVGKVDDVRFGTLICFEGTFPELARLAVNQGAMVLVQITNDGWFGKTAAPAQHLQIAAVRAIETRRHLIRAANTGYSAFITPWGDIEERTGLFEEAEIVRTIRPITDTTPFLLFGYWPAYLVIIVSLSSAAVVRFSGRPGAAEGTEQ